MYIGRKFAYREVQNGLVPCHLHHEVLIAPQVDLSTAHQPMQGGASVVHRYVHCHWIHTLVHHEHSVVLRHAQPVQVAGEARAVAVGNTAGRGIQCGLDKSLTMLRPQGNEGKWDNNVHNGTTIKHNMKINLMG